MHGTVILMLENKMMVGILVGLLADAVKLTFNYISFRLNFTSVVFWQLIAALFLDGEDVFTPMGLLIGATADIIVASFLGVVFIYIIYFTGKENLWIKGLGFAMLGWVSMLGVILHQLIKNTIPPDPAGILVTIGAHFLYGLALAAFTKLLAGKLIPFNEDLKNSELVQSLRLTTPTPLKKLTIKKKHKAFKKPQKI